jgi:hypothetical protein
LSRELLGPGRHRTHDHRLRRAARTLAPFRDARVRLDAFLAIASATKLPVTGLHLRRRLRRTESSMPAAMRRVERILEKELHSAARLPLKALPRPECAAALERMRAEMDAAFVAGRASGDIELLHKWRKRTKNYLHALAFVESRKNPRHRSAVRINRLLGLDHDLALLESGLTERLDKPETQLLLAQIAKRRAKLRGQLFG